MARVQAAAREHIDAATTPYPDSIMEPLSLSPTLATTFPHVRGSPLPPALSLQQPPCALLPPQLWFVGK